MESEKEKLIQSLEDAESDTEETDEIEYVSRIINIMEISCESEEENFENNKNIIENDNEAPIRPALIDKLDICNILNTKEIFSKSDVVFDVTNTTTFFKLPPDTDLNVPPANWLNPNLNLPNPIKIKIKSEESTSFSIANMFPGYYNKIDIVAEADIIKQIFKILYNQEYVSMIVRKIGNVLLIDNFDADNFSNIKEDTNENSLNTTYKEYFDKLKKIHGDPRKANNSNEKLHQRNLHSKFLYRSVVDDPKAPEEAGEVQKFNRIIYWTFEKTRMIIGTNEPKTNLFENRRSRNVSLHVARAEKPLKVLNAIDMWLDNLMYDIPEAVICFHSDGMVNHYKCIQTQDIPYLPGSPFSVHQIKNSVQNIFSFLQNQKYQTGQVYSLVKGRNDDFLKFIDLNMSEETDVQVKMMNIPFTNECGKLSYRFGHNQYYSSDKRKELNYTHLLDASITTLNPKIHPEIIASANYLIVDLNFSYEIFKTSLFTLSKIEFGKCKKKPESVKKRCLRALADINDGLKCLQNFRVSENSQQNNLKKNIESNNTNKGNYNIKKDKKQAQNEFFYINISSLFPKKEHRALEALPTWDDVNEDRDYWKNYLKFLFYQKAELIYGILAQEYFYYGMFELCLRSLDMMVRFNKVKTKIDPSSHTIPFNFVLVMAGDCCKLAPIADLSKNSDCVNVANIENILIIDEQYYKVTPNNYNLQLNLMDYSRNELIHMAFTFYEEFWTRICNRKCATEIDKNFEFILKKLFIANLTLGLIHCEILDKSRKEFNYLDHYERSKKYLNGAVETAGSPTEKAKALFRFSELHILIFSISLYKDLPSSEENNVIVYFRVFLDSITDSLQILYDSNNEESTILWHKFFNKSFNSIDFLIVWFTTVGNKIVDKIRHLVSEGLASGLKKVLKICELQKQRYEDEHSYFACGRVHFLTANNLFTGMVLQNKSHFTITRDHFVKAIEYFSQKNLWWFSVTVLANFTNLAWCQGQDGYDLPLKRKMENMRYCLKVCYQTCMNLHENSFEDEQINTTLKKYIPEIHVNFQRLLSKCIEYIQADSQIAKTSFDELRTFKNYLNKFNDINNEDEKLYFTTLFVTLNRMGISMKFA